MKKFHHRDTEFTEVGQTLTADGRRLTQMKTV
jgi:hypothetical protein